MNSSTMRLLRVLLISTTFVFLCLPTRARAQKINIDAAKKEGRVVLYGTVPSQSVVERTIFMDPPTAEEFKQLSSLFREIFFGK